MADQRLPKTKARRVDWVIRAPDNQEMRRRYDAWASLYDADVGSISDYLAPIKLAEVAQQHLDADMCIFDAGAGTGLVGQALKDKGFGKLMALDYSEKMLEVARAKGIYDQVHQCDLTQPTDMHENSADALVTCGTTTQIPCASLHEYARLVRSGGKILFAAVQGTWEETGYAAILASLEAEGKASITFRGAPFQMMPTTEPDFICEILVIDIR